MIRSWSSLGTFRIDHESPYLWRNDNIIYIDGYMANSVFAIEVDLEFPGGVHEKFRVYPWINDYGQKSWECNLSSFSHYTLDNDYFIPTFYAIGEDGQRTGDSLGFAWQFLGETNPASILRPYAGDDVAKNPEFVDLLPKGSFGMPSKMLRPLPGVTNYFEMYGLEVKTLGLDFKIIEDFWATDASRINAIYERDPLFGLPINNVGIRIGDDEVVKKVKLGELDCGKQYAAVSWVSFTGLTRVHTFEIRDIKESSDIMNLTNVADKFVYRKGTTYSCSLVLENLDAFDTWYYADLMKSNDVEISFDGINWNKVDVQSKDVQFSNSQIELNTLSIDIVYNEHSVNR